MTKQPSSEGTKWIGRDGYSLFRPPPRHTYGYNFGEGMRNPIRRADLDEAVRATTISPLSLRVGAWRSGTHQA